MVTQRVGQPRVEIACWLPAWRALGLPGRCQGPGVVITGRDAMLQAGDRSTVKRAACGSIRAWSRQDRGDRGVEAKVETSEMQRACHLLLTDESSPRVVRNPLELCRTR